MTAPNKKDAEKVITVTDERKARTKKKVANLKGMESGMASGMKKGAHSNEQPAR